VAHVLQRRRACLQPPYSALHGSVSHPRG
jgi:hypothetical protein